MRVVDRTLSEHLLVRPFLAALLCLFVSGCTNTTRTAEWSQSDYAGDPLKELLVVGIAKDESTRRIFESTFVAQLREQNIKAQGSYSLIADGRSISRETVASAIKGTSIDAVLALHLLGVSEKEIYVPGAYVPYPVGAGHGRSLHDHHASIFAQI